jgi:hypothetical protein
MFARRAKLCLRTMGGDKGSRGDLALRVLLTKAARSNPDSQRNRNCTKKLRRNAQLCLLCVYDMFAPSRGCWSFEVLESQQMDFAIPVIVFW